MQEDVVECLARDRVERGAAFVQVQLVKEADRWFVADYEVSNALDGFRRPVVP